MPVAATMSPEPYVRRAARVLLGRWCRVSVTGLEHLPTAGPTIIAATHASHADSIALGLASPRPLAFLGDRRLLDWPLIGRWLPTFGLVPIDRGHADLGALGRVAQAVNAGEAVVLYPEGSRSRDGAVHRPRSGVSRLAAMTDAVVVPAGIVGTAELWPVEGRPRVRGGDITVRFGSPMTAPADDPVSRRTWSRGLHAELVRLSGAPRADSFAPIRAA